jgi:hypothetical protein
MLKRRDLNDSHTLGYEGRNKIKSSSGSTSHVGGTSPGGCSDNQFNSSVFC